MNKKKNVNSNLKRFKELKAKINPSGNVFNIKDIDEWLEFKSLSTKLNIQL
jgi:hypothetical protein